jgi:hypothetical protein
MRFEKNQKNLLDDETFSEFKRQVQIRSQTAEESLEQLYQKQAIWLATPLPLRTRLKLRMKRQLRKLRQITAAIRPWKDSSRSL